AAPVVPAFGEELDPMLPQAPNLSIQVVDAERQPVALARGNGNSEPLPEPSVVEQLDAAVGVVAELRPIDADLVSGVQPKRGNPAWAERRIPCIHSIRPGSALMERVATRLGAAVAIVALLGALAAFYAVRASGAEHVHVVTTANNKTLGKKILV